MACKDVLIVSPTNIKFQAPFPHSQKRQLSLLNLGGQPMIYNIEISNEALIQVLPPSGKVPGFDTIALTIQMQSTQQVPAACSLTVKHKIKTEEADGAENWTQARSKVVNITLQNCVESKELSRMFGMENYPVNLIESVIDKSQPLCADCCQRCSFLPNLGQSFRELAFWPLLLLLLAVTAYLIWNW